MVLPQKVIPVVDANIQRRITADSTNVQRPRPYAGNHGIVTADGTPLKIQRIGESSVKASSNNSFILRDILNVSSSTRNLLSINQFCIDNNVFLIFDSQKVEARDSTTNEVLLEGKVHQGLYRLSLSLQQQEEALVCSKQSYDLWHCRLGHLNAGYISILLNNGVINVDSKNKGNLCSSCLAGKSHSLPHSPRNTSYKPLSLIFADIWGPSLVVSHQGYSYYINFVDAETNFNWVFLLVRKSDLYSVFKNFYTWAERQSGFKIQAVQSDNAM